MKPPKELVRQWARDSTCQANASGYIRQQYQAYGRAEGATMMLQEIISYLEDSGDRLVADELRKEYG